MKVKSAITTIVSAALIVIFAYLLSFGLIIGDYEFRPLKSVLKLGLDLRGGVSILMEAQDKNVKADDLETARQLLELRVNNLGVSEASVTISGQNRILIEIPSIYDAEKALEQVGRTGELKFLGPDKSVVLTGQDIADALVGVDQQTSQPVVQLKLKSSGVTKFAEATQKFLNQQIAIYMDEDMISNPRVAAVITNGEARIDGMANVEEAKRIAGIIKSGALPVKLKPATVRVVGPSLGAEAIPTSFKAAVIGIAIVMLFMLLYYKLPGVIADFALAVYIMLTLLIFTLVIKQTLTLPGIAGFLLSIGMAVDANVLIFERIKEELKIGKSLKTAIDSGFHRALSSILDSNITTLIAGFVLYFVGTGGVKGFALTLNIGVLCSMFTAITVTRFLLKSVVSTGWFRNTKFYGA